MNDMEITSAQYVSDVVSNEPCSIKAIIDGQVMFVPVNSTGNRHYAAIMRQVDAGTLTIADAE